MQEYENALLEMKKLGLADDFPPSIFSDTKDLNLQTLLTTIKTQPQSTQSLRLLASLTNLSSIFLIILNQISVLNSSSTHEGVILQNLFFVSQIINPNTITQLTNTETLDEIFILSSTRISLLPAITKIYSLIAQLNPHIFTKDSKIFTSTTIIDESFIHILSIASLIRNSDFIFTCLRSILKKKENVNQSLVKQLMSSLVQIVSEKEVAMRIIRENDILELILTCESISKITPVLLDRAFIAIEIEKGLMVEFEEALVKCLNSFYKSGRTMVALSSLSAVLQTNPVLGCKILQKPEMIDEIADAFEFEKDHVIIATLDMLSNACSDKATRLLIISKCAAQLLVLSTSHKNKLLKTAALTTLIKSSVDPTQETDPEDFKIIVEQTRQLLANDAQITLNFTTNIEEEEVDGKEISSEVSDLVLNSVESLAYLSVRPKIKVRLIENHKFLKSLIGWVDSSGVLGGEENRALAYGIAMILYNLSAFPRHQSEEELQIKKLRHMANATKTTSPASSNNSDDYIDDPLNSRPNVNSRIQTLIKTTSVNKKLNKSQTILTSLSKLSKSKSPNTQLLVLKTLLNIATPTTNRSKMVQQGIIPTLLTLTSSLSPTPSEPITESFIFAAQTIAKIAISVNPNIAFTPSQASSLLRPLHTLLLLPPQLKESQQLPPPTLLQFEALLALTNLSSMDDPTARRVLVNPLKIHTTVDSLILSDNQMVRRAAVECMCNLMYEPQVYILYITPSSSSNLLKKEQQTTNEEEEKEDEVTTKIGVMIALCDSEDFETRRAASGVLAILSQTEEGCDAILAEKRVCKSLVGLVDDEEEEVFERVVEVWRNLKEFGRLGGLVRFTEKVEKRGKKAVVK